MMRRGRSASMVTVLTLLAAVAAAQERAPFAGVVNHVIATPPISVGEPLAMVSRVQAMP